MTVNGIIRALRTLVLGAVTAVAMAEAAAAATLSFNFSFTNNSALGGGAVTGIVRGLLDDATGAATSVEVLTNSAGFGVGEYVGFPFLNSWTVVNGVLTSFDFASALKDNASPDVTLSTLGLTSGALNAGNVSAGLRVFPAPLTLSSDVGLTFTPAPVPLPASLWLMLGAMGGLGALRRRRRAA